MNKTLEQQFIDACYKNAEGNLWEGYFLTEDVGKECAKVAKRYTLQEKINLLTEIYDALDSGKIDISKYVQ